MQTSED